MCSLRAQVLTPSYGGRCDLLVGLDGFHVIEVAEHPGRMQVVVESAPELMGCRACGVLVGSHGRRDVVLVDVPCFGRPVQLVWRKRTWRCAEVECTGKAFTEQHADLARPPALLTTRACWWAVGQLRRKHASVAGIARQLSTTWRTCGGRSRRCWKGWPPTRPASPTSPPWAWTSTSRTTSPRSRSRMAAAAPRS